MTYKEISYVVKIVSKLFIKVETGHHDSADARAELLTKLVNYKKKI